MYRLDVILEYPELDRQSTIAGLVDWTGGLDWWTALVDSPKFPFYV